MVPVRVVRVSVVLLAISVYGIGGAAYSLAVAIFVLAVLDRLHELAVAEEHSYQGA